MSLQLESLMKLVAEFDTKTPHVSYAKACQMVIDWLPTQIGPERTYALHTSSLLSGVPIYLNEEIPPDRMVFYDQHGEVFHVQMLDMESVLAHALRPTEEPENPQ